MDTYIVTIGFTPSRILENCLRQVYKTIGIVPKRHILLDNNYPKNRDKNSLEIHKLCRQYYMEYYNCGENMGLGAGYRWLVDKCNAQDGDIIIGIDPDTWPITPNWGIALQEVMSADDRVGWASLNVTPHTAREMQERGGKQSMLGSYVIQECPAACLNSICAWRPAMLRDVGGIHEPRKYYGGTESHMKPKLNLHNWRWVYLMDYKEEWNESVDSEEDYKEYKRQYVHGKTKDDFGTWLTTQQG